LQDRVIGLAAGIALALLGLRLRHGLDVSTEILPWHDLLDRFQRIAQSANRLQPALNIEKALLPHDPLAPDPPMTAHGHRVRFVATWREEFFEVPLWYFKRQMLPGRLILVARSCVHGAGSQIRRHTCFDRRSHA